MCICSRFKIKTFLQNAKLARELRSVTLTVLISWFKTKIPFRNVKGTFSLMHRHSFSLSKSKDVKPIDIILSKYLVSFRILNFKIIKVNACVSNWEQMYISTFQGLESPKDHGCICSFFGLCQ
ncbi:unnamed protein product [Arabidopsis halleri]